MSYKNLEQGQLGFQVVDLETNEVLISHQANKVFPSASVMKVVTTAASWKLLDHEHPFTTKIGYSGLIDQGTLKGDLILYGGGDPTLNSSYFEDHSIDRFFLFLEQSLRKKQIRQIEGNVIIDIGHFQGEVIGPNWPWSDLGNYYASPCWGINVSDNLYKLYLRQNPKLNGPVEVEKISPEIAGLEHQSLLVSGKANSGDQAYIYGAPMQYNRKIRGTIPLGKNIFTIKGSMPHAPSYFKSLLSSNLDRKGIVYNQILVQEIGGSEQNILGEYHSPRLQRILDITNKKSVNLFAEALMRQMGTTQKSKSASTLQDGLAVVRELYSQNNLPMSEFWPVDGSGLSPQNKLSANFLTSLLSKINDNPEWRDAIFKSFAVAGKSGTLKNMFRSSPAKGKILAKSGYIEKNRTYAGIVHTKSGKKLAFAVFAHNYNGSNSVMRKKLENWMNALYSFY